MKVSNHSAVPVYTISGSSTARPLPEWLARKRKRSLKTDPEYASRIELLQDFEFEEASQCVRVSDDGQWVMSTGMRALVSRILYYVKRRAFLTNDLYQEPTSLKSTPTTYHISHSHTLAIPTLSTPPSSFFRQTIPNRYTSRQIALLSSTLPADAITLPDCPATAET